MFESAVFWGVLWKENKLQGIRRKWEGRNGDNGCWHARGVNSKTGWWLWEVGSHGEGVVWEDGGKPMYNEKPKGRNQGWEI